MNSYCLQGHTLPPSVTGCEAGEAQFNHIFSHCHILEFVGDEVFGQERCHH